MTELSFAKSYLSLLDSRPIKLQADHISPPQSLELNGAYTLPRYPGSTTMHRPGTKTSTDTAAADDNKTTTPSTDNSSKTATIHLKSTRNPTLSLSLPSTPTNTSILDLKERVASEIKQSSPSTSSSQIRLLYNKKPCSDAKTIRNVVGDDTLSSPDVKETGVEFSVMIMGYSAASSSDSGTQSSGADAKGVSGGAETEAKAEKDAKDFVSEVMSGDKFWGDLRAWVGERVRDKGVAGTVVEGWRGQWKDGLGKGR